MRDPQHVNLGLEGGNGRIKLNAALGQSPVFRPEPGLVDHAGLVQVIELVGLGGELCSIPFKDRQKFLLLPHRHVRVRKVCGNLRIREEKLGYLRMEHGLKVIQWNAVPARLAGVLGAI